MKLQKITINNYKSIDQLELVFDKYETNRGLFGFLGINEAGKSNLLKAISLKNNLSDFNYKDSRRKEVEEDVEIIYEFHLNSNLIFDLLTKNKTIDVPEEFLKEIKIINVIISSVIENGKSPINKVYFKLENEIIKGWETDQVNLVKRSNKKTLDGELDLESELNLNDFLRDRLSKEIISESPEIIFWKSEDKYLMNSVISLAQFKENPQTVSIPLKNCFIIAGYKNIKETIDKSNLDAAFKGDLYEQISLKVTNFINDKWPEHKVELKFEESGGQLNFFVKNIDGKRQDVTSRSDGFRQFISFLLTSSAEVSNGEMKDSIIIIDEPEIHLHPTSQEDLLKELIKISKNNIIMFATHSSYLIDKNNFSNYYKIYKFDDKTEIEQFNNNSTTFSEINYIVFNIPTTDYHNELYGWCEANDKLSFLNNSEKDYIKLKKDLTKLPSKKISLAEYIRHQIHHPENKENKPFTDKELKSSIDILRGLKYGSN
jgi:predicted ATP-dependent endonuclease of OLD family